MFTSAPNLGPHSPFSRALVTASKPKQLWGLGRVERQRWPTATGGTYSDPSQAGRRRVVRATPKAPGTGSGPRGSPWLQLSRASGPMYCNMIAVVVVVVSTFHVTYIPFLFSGWNDKILVSSQV